MSFAIATQAVAIRPIIITFGEITNDVPGTIPDIKKTRNASIIPDCARIIINAILTMMYLKIVCICLSLLQSFVVVLCNIAS